MQSGGNGLMTKGDKDFITRIQLSQLYNSLGPDGSHDPYADDFYYHVFKAIRASRSVNEPTLEQQQHSNRMGTGQGQQRARRDHASKMAQQVQRLVEDAKKNPRATQGMCTMPVIVSASKFDRAVALEGALGRISMRTKAAPRQALQLAPAAPQTNRPKESGPVDPTRPAVPTAAELRRILLNLETLYDIVLELEQLRRLQLQLDAAAGVGAGRVLGHPVRAHAESQQAHALAQATARYQLVSDKLWAALHVMDPLDDGTRLNPPLHPFVKLLGPSKGKRLLPRIVRHLSDQQVLTVVTLLLATFATLDVVRRAEVLNVPPTQPNADRAEVAAATEAFLSTVIPVISLSFNKLTLKIVTGLTNLLLERNNIVYIARTKVGQRVKCSERR